MKSVRSLEKTYHSNGKLLLTGEYVVLDGAMALAIPTKYGQTIEIHTSDKQAIHWRSFDDNNNIWFEDVFDIKTLGSSDSKNPISITLSKILQEAKKLNPDFLSKETGYKVDTKLDFPRNWGLGTSSTLINNIAQWSKTNAFALLNNSFGGSGYDIAAAQNDFPILYKTDNGQTNISKATLDWSFKDSLFFVYLNQKQDSKEGIAHYKKTGVEKTTIKRISEISLELGKCKSLKKFENLIEEHETLICKTIGLPTIKEKLFENYPGSIKSLGAWGGDFVLVTGFPENLNYFKEKGFETIISFSEMTTLKA